MLVRDLATQRSQTGFLIYLNSALIYWHSNKQTPVETLTFRSKFIVMKHCTHGIWNEYIQGLQFKLQMMRITINVPPSLYIERVNLFWFISLDLTQCWRRNQTVLLSILSKKGQQETNGELFVVLSPMKTHLIYWPNTFLQGLQLQGRRDECLVTDHYIITYTPLTA